MIFVPGWMSPCKGRCFWVPVLQPEARLHGETPFPLTSAILASIYVKEHSPHTDVELLLGSWCGDAALVFPC